MKTTARESMTSKHRKRMLPGLLVLLLCLTVGAAVLPGAVRVLPGRYAYYLPASLRALRQGRHPITLPAPVLSPRLPLSLTMTSDADPASRAFGSLSSSLPAAHLLTGMYHEPQGWNNCAPATLAMALSFWGRVETQYDIAPVLKPDPEDPHVDASDLVDYAEGLGLAATLRVGGDLILLKQLLAHGYPVIVETWEVRDTRDQLGHYRLLVGYDDAAEHFIVYDSLLGPDFPMTYTELDELWRVFNRLYLIIYPTARAAEIAQLLGSAWDTRVAYTHALEIALAEARDPPTECVAYAACADAETFAWFNVGSSLVELKRYAEAAPAFDQARLLGLSWRMLWYQFGPYVAYDAIGRYDDVVVLADATLHTSENQAEAYYWRGRARIAQGNTRGAQADFAAALRYHPGWPPAQETLQENGQ